MLRTRVSIWPPTPSDQQDFLLQASHRTQSEKGSLLLSMEIYSSTNEWNLPHILPNCCESKINETSLVRVWLEWSLQKSVTRGKTSLTKLLQRGEEQSVGPEGRPSVFLNVMWPSNHIWKEKKIHIRPGPGCLGEILFNYFCFYPIRQLTGNFSDSEKGKRCLK